MEVFINTATQMLILFAILSVGYAARRKGVMDDTFDKKLTWLVVNVAMPSLVVAAVLGAETLPDPYTVGMILLWGSVSYLLVIAIAMVVAHFFHTDTKKKGVLEFLMVFGNIGFIGFPVLSVIFGPEGLIYGAIFNIPSTFFCWSAGVLMISHDDEGQHISVPARLKELAGYMLSPCMIACLIALALTLLRVSDNGPVFSALSLMGQVTVPGAMLIIGSSLAKMPVKEMFKNISPYIATTFRLLVIPAATFLVLNFFVEDPMLVGVITVCMAMPAASTGTMMCINYHSDVKTMAQGTFLSTVFSLGTIPTVAMFLV